MGRGRADGSDLTGLLIIILGGAVSICGFFVGREILRQDKIDETVRKIEREVQSVSHSIRYLNEEIGAIKKRLER